jgi:tripartite-type tricarboxylate transporter receptor subunit TctC
MNLFRTTLIATAIVMSSAHFSVAFAQAYPNKPIRLIVPVASAGASDGFARIVAQALGDRLGQSVVVENRTGAGGTLGANFVAKAPADGYTLFVGDTGTHGIATSLYPKLPYNAITDFTPLSHSATGQLVMVTVPSLPIKDVREFINYAKAKPGKTDYASGGSGGISHLAVELFKMQTGTFMVHVPYRGGSPALTDVIGGQVQMMMPSLATAMPHIRAGRLKAIGVSSSKRSPLLPDVPTLKESGLADFSVESWVGILAPAGIPKNVSDILQKEIAAVLATPAVRDKLIALGSEVPAGNGDALSRVIQTDVLRWAKVVKQSGAQID